MHQRVTIVLAILFGLGTAIFGALYFQKENGLPTLPVPASSRAGKQIAPEIADVATTDSLYYPYYFGAPQYQYRYSLNTDFPSVGETLPVYSVVPTTYDRATAITLAARFGFTEEPLEFSDSFVFTSGTTPSSIYRENGGSSSGSSGSGSTGIPSQEKTTIDSVAPDVTPTEPTVIPPDTADTYDGKELTISSAGYISYTDYSVSLGASAQTIDVEGEKTPTTSTPQGVTDDTQAIQAAVAFLETVQLLPAVYDSTAGDPYGVYPVTITPTRDGYPVQAGAISLQIGDGGIVASASLRQVTTTIFSPYPIKNAEETLKLETLEYQINTVTISYVSSYDDQGVEYIQPVYVLNGTDSLGNPFQFEIPAVQASFLEQNKVVPLQQDDPIAF